MPTLLFLGSVHPRYMDITLPEMRVDELREAVTDPSVQFRVAITRSLIRVECLLEQDDASINRTEVFLKAIDHCRALIDCVAFAEGLALTVLIDEMVETDGTRKPVFHKDTKLKQLCTAFELIQPFPQLGELPQMFVMVAKEPALQYALSDLIVAITVPGHIAVNCARALEGIRNILVPDEPSRTTAWAEMRRVLCLDRSYLDVVIQASVKPRHGDKALLDPVKAREILEHSWTVMNRFLEFRKRGSVGLSDKEFPNLV